MALVIIAYFSSCKNSEGTNATNKSEIDSLRTQIKELMAANEMVAKNLAKFDTLDFNVFSRRDWARFHESHAEDVVVHFPDGHTTKGLKKHIDDMEAMFVYAPDTRISVHPIKVGQGNLTAVTGVMEGTFTKPMPVGNGKFIQPTGKAFKIPMATVSIWKLDGTMSEEYLFWDNQTYMNQLGIGK
ncbi:polyketide cyclase [Pedobacter ginsengisoli]|uniref:Polyketide cyclase n=2 Tax=Pedobacter ginsengisoli TaxID=363852 RepID=A0A2D1UC17_9SPHI|nr:polyketide cyclase [Pedobacter ginsengisoli]